MERGELFWSSCEFMRVDSASLCPALQFNCLNGSIDDNERSR